MNTSRLKEIVETLLKLDSEHNIQGVVDQVAANVVQLTQNPAQQAMQAQVHSSLQQLKQSLVDLNSHLSAAQRATIDDMGGGRYFNEGISDEIRGVLNQNSATPAVVQNLVNELAQGRRGFIQNLQQLNGNLSAIGIKANPLNPGEAEVGFLLPRDIFHNELEGLIKELQQVRLMVRAFSELATGRAESIEVKTISTSDPIFFFGLTVTTIGLIGRTVHWALDTWKKVEELKKIREETRKLKALPSPELDVVVGMFETSIKSGIEKAVDEKVESLLLENKVTDQTRANEQRPHLHNALVSLLSHVERGMTVEIRLLPPPAPANDVVATTEETQTQEAFVELDALSKKLYFPPPSDAPILKLPGASSGSGSDGDV